MPAEWPFVGQWWKYSYFVILYHLPRIMLLAQSLQIPFHFSSLFISKYLQINLVLSSNKPDLIWWYLCNPHRNQCLHTADSSYKYKFSFPYFGVKPYSHCLCWQGGMRMLAYQCIYSIDEHSSIIKIENLEDKLLVTFSNQVRGQLPITLQSFNMITNSCVYVSVWSSYHSMNFLMRTSIVLERKPFIQQSSLSQRDRRGHQCINTYFVIIVSRIVFTIYVASNRQPVVVIFQMHLGGGSE